MSWEKIKKGLCAPCNDNNEEKSHLEREMGPPAQLSPPKIAQSPQGDEHMSYDALSQTTGKVTCQNYKVHPNHHGNPEFFIYASLNQDGIPDREKENFGLKFHISLNETDPEKYKEGWAVIRDILIENNIALFKVFARYNKGERMSSKEGQEGKDITIYADRNPQMSMQDWEKILQKITQELVKRNIPPGFRPSGEKEPEYPIQNSNYITYRFFDEDNKRPFRPDPDPCNQINIKVENQPPRPPLIRQRAPEITNMISIQPQ